MGKCENAIYWIAHNDEPTIEDASVIFGFVTVGLIADIFKKDQMEVAEDVSRLRQFAVKED